MSAPAPAVALPVKAGSTEAPGAYEGVVADLEGRQRRARRSGRLGGLLIPLGSLAAVLLAWHILVVALDIPHYVLPRPALVWETMVSARSTLLANAWPTLQEIAMGFALSVVVGIPLGIGISEFKWFGRFVEPMIVASQAVPKIAVAPLFLVWWGFGMTPKVLIAFLVAFFPVVISTTVGLGGVPGELVDLGRSMGARRGKMLLRIKLPGAMPSIFGGLRVAMTLAVIGAIVGEFVGADQGLGRLIVVANGRLNTQLVFAAVVALTVLGVLAYKVVELAERAVIPWHREKAALAGHDG